MDTLYIILIIVLAFVLIMAIGFFFTGKIAFDIALNPHHENAPVSDFDRKSGNKKTPLVDPACTTGAEWFDNYTTIKVEQTSYDSLRLAGEIVENAASGNSKFAILCHGYTGHRREMGFFAQKFYDNGFSILVPSARAHDESEGDYIGMGWDERRDIAGWINIISERYNSPEIVLFGISMGGATVMCTAGEDLPANVKCVVEDCGFTSVKEQFAHSIKNIAGLPAFPTVQAMAFYTRLKTHSEMFRDGSAVKQLAGSHIPVFFVHGKLDRFVPSWMIDKCYEAHPGPKEKLIIEDAHHGGSAWVGGDLYWNSVMKFVEKYIS